MPTRAQVRDLIAAGDSYEQAARRLGIPPGQAYMIATGLPAEGGGHHLTNPPAHNPTHEQDTMAWVRERAKRDLQPGEAPK